MDQQRIGSLSGQKGSHSGQNQARFVSKTLTSYNIQNRLGDFVIDNTSRNDTLIEYISEDLEEERIVYDLCQHRLRCNSHIINLAVCDFIFGKHPDAEKQVDGTLESRSGPNFQELNIWRRLGPLGKLHNIIFYIMASPQRIQVFIQWSGGHIPQGNNKSWWNSGCMMSDWSLTKTRVIFFLFCNSKLL